MRQRSTTRSGGSYDAAEILAVWNKGHIIPGQDPTLFRKDACEAWMNWAAYGKTVDLGWEIDHIIPIAKAGSEKLENLQPLQWENNRRKSDHCPWSYSDAA